MDLKLLQTTMTQPQEGIFFWRS